MWQPGQEIKRNYLRMDKLLKSEKASLFPTPY